MTTAQIVFKVEEFFSDMSEDALRKLMSAFCQLASDHGCLRLEQSDDSALLLTLHEADAYTIAIREGLANTRLRSACARVCVLCAELTKTYKNPYGDKATISVRSAQGEDVDLTVVYQNTGGNYFVEMQRVRDEDTKGAPKSEKDGNSFAGKRDEGAEGALESRNQ